MGNSFRSILRNRLFLTAVLGGLLFMGALTGCDMSGEDRRSRYVVSRDFEHASDDDLKAFFDGVMGVPGTAT